MVILKLLRYLLITVVVLFILFQVKFMPSYQTQLSYRGHQINITRDHTYNIPSIRGESKLAAFYGFGYATAEDRLFQIHMKRMVGKGRVSEVVGEKGLSIDTFFRELGVGYNSRQSVERMKAEDPKAFQAYQAYADGVNAYVKDSGVGIQFYVVWSEFEPWQVEDSFVIFKLTDWVQSSDGGLTVVRELLAQEVGKEEADKILGSREQHFILVNESTMMSNQELEISGQNRIDESPNLEQQVESDHVEVPYQEAGQTLYEQTESGEERQRISSIQEERNQQIQEVNETPEQETIDQNQENIPEDNPIEQHPEQKIITEDNQPSDQSQHHQSENINQQESIPPTPEAVEDTQSAYQIDEPIKSQDIDPALLGMMGGGASNSWVISGEHTKSGRPILANDPHLATTIPSDWFQARIQYPFEGRNVVFKGAFIAGTSLSAPLGRSDFAAWGCTTEYKDTQDLYKQRVEGSRYFVDGEWRNLNQRQERIRVKNGEDKIITVSETHRGPLLTKIAFLEKIFDVPGNVSFAWTGTHTEHSFLSFMIQIMEADSYEDTIAKFASLDYGPAMNVVFITRDDDIGYQSIGRVPRRKGSQSSFFHDGTTTENDWDGFISGRDKLYLDNPEKGFIVTANSRPASSNFKQGYYNTNFQVTSRQHRISKILRQSIASGEKLGVEDSIKIQLDNIDEYCLHVLPYLKQIDHRFSSLMDGWNCNFSSTAYEPSIYEGFMLKLQHKLYTHKTLNIYGFLAFNHYTYKFIISAAETLQSTSINKITESLTEALQMLKTKFKGTSKQNWKWGHLHVTSYPHLPFSNSPLKSLFDRYHVSSGSLNTPNMGKMTKLHQESFNCQHHASLRMVLTYQPNESKWVIDTGISSYPFSNHYDDQQLLHKEGKYIDFDSNENPSVWQVVSEL